MANENRYYKTPFAESGNKAEIPDVSTGGAVGYDTGYGPDYELAQGSASRKRIERDLYNGMFNGVTSNLKQWQENLYPTWIEDNGFGAALPYNEGMIVNHEGVNYISLEDSNQEEPNTGDKWAVYDATLKNKNYIGVKSLSDITLEANFTEGSYIRISDRGYGLFKMTSSGSPDGVGILATGTSGIYAQIEFEGSIDLVSLGMIADSTGAGVGTDNSEIYQYAFDKQLETGLPINQGVGRRRIAQPLEYITSDGDPETASGLVMSGNGIGKTVIQNDVVGTMCVVRGQGDFIFAKGSELSGFTVIGKGVSGEPDQVVMRHQSSLYNSYKDVRIIKNNGTAVQSGDSDATDPDSTASAQFDFDTCEFDDNVIGFDNPQNNNSPLVIFLNSSVRNNSRGGVRCNSSYIQAKGSSISFNGLTDPSNAFGGIDVAQQGGSALSDGYRTKGFVIDTTELDTNYPWNVRCLQAENPEIRNCSTQFRDYPGIDWAGNGITTFPESQFIFGGSGVNEKCFEAMFNNNRVSIVSNGNLLPNPSGHSVVYVGEGGIGTNFQKIVYSLDFSGTSHTIGNEFYIITEPQKTGAFDNRKYYVEYDYPKSNFSTADLIAGFSQCHYRKIFPSFSAQTGEGMHFALSVTDDNAVNIPLPQLSSDSPSGQNYNQLSITISGTSNHIVAMRCASSPFAELIASGFNSIEVGTGTATGTTGVDGDITVFADTDGTCWIENRSGASINCQASFLMSPGLVNQIS